MLRHLCHSVTRGSTLHLAAGRRRRDLNEARAGNVDGAGAGNDLLPSVIWMHTPMPALIRLLTLNLLFSLLPDHPRIDRPVNQKRDWRCQRIICSLLW